MCVVERFSLGIGLQRLIRYMSLEGPNVCVRCQMEKGTADSFDDHCRGSPLETSEDCYIQRSLDFPVNILA